MFDEIVEIVEYFLKNNNLEWLITDMRFIIALVLVSLSFIIGLVKLIFFINKQFRLKRMSRNLKPYFTSQEIKHHTKNYIQTRSQNVPPSNEDEPIDSIAATVTQRLIPLMWKQILPEKNPQKYILILADSGMGKTTFSINLFIKQKSRITLFGLLPKKNIFLFPLGLNDVFSEIEKIDPEIKKNSYLILDALDEDEKALNNYEERIAEIVLKTYGFLKVIITSRTQFFASDKEEPFETNIPFFGNYRGFHTIKKLYISPFNDDDVLKYLFKKYSLLRPLKIRKAYRVIKKIKKLIVRPMLLNYIDDLLNVSKDLKHTFQIYDYLIEKWIERESLRYSKDIQEGYKKNLRIFTEAMAKEIFLEKDKKSSIYLTKGRILELARVYMIPFSELELTSRSLLNRNIKGNIKFSHKSILENYFSIFLSNGNFSFRAFNFDGFDMTAQFLSEREYTKSYKVYFEKSISQLKSELLGLYCNDGIYDLNDIIYFVPKKKIEFSKFDKIIIGAPKITLHKLDSIKSTIQENLAKIDKKNKEVTKEKEKIKNSLMNSKKFKELVKTKKLENDFDEKSENKVLNDLTKEKLFATKLFNSKIQFETYTTEKQGIVKHLAKTKKDIEFELKWINYCLEIIEKLKGKTIANNGYK